MCKYKIMVGENLSELIRVGKDNFGECQITAVLAGGKLWQIIFH